MLGRELVGNRQRGRLGVPLSGRIRTNSHHQQLDDLALHSPVIRDFDVVHLALNWVSNRPASTNCASYASAVACCASMACNVTRSRSDSS
jgi:hypothetical protein